MNKKADRTLLGILFLIALFLHTPLISIQATPGKIKTLYNSLDPSSISQHLAFYELYQGSQEGERALQHAWELLTGQEQRGNHSLLRDPSLNVAVNGLVALINKQSAEPPKSLTDSELLVIEGLGNRLGNRKLKGRNARSESEVLSLSPDEIDLSRGLLLTQFGNSAEGIRQVRTYEALMDLMALQILARLPQDAVPSTKIRVMNDFIFGEMGFRFPPHSVYAKDIDVYTFLPSVLDGRQGVCLGVSILYICLAQRLDLSLEMITPPGHIYVRYREGNSEINIETTARGVHIDSEEYLTIGTRALQQRNVKEVIGLAYFNQASVFLTQENYAEALKSYQKAEPYLPGDTLLTELMAFQYLLTGNEAEGIRLLKQIENDMPEFAVSKENMAEDFLRGNVTMEGIKVYFQPVDEDRKSIIKKRDELQRIMTQYPKFRAGLFSLAVAWLQLHRKKEALEVLEQYHQLDPNDPTAEYYLTMLYAERVDYDKAWRHLYQAEKIVKDREHDPKVLKDVRKALNALYPE